MTMHMEIVTPSCIPQSISNNCIISRKTLKNGFHDLCMEMKHYPDIDLI